MADSENGKFSIEWRRDGFHEVNSVKCQFRCGKFRRTSSLFWVIANFQGLQSEVKVFAVKPSKIKGAIQTVGM